VKKEERKKTGNFPYQPGAKKDRARETRETNHHKDKKKIGVTDLRPLWNPISPPLKQYWGKKKKSSLLPNPH